MMRHYGSIGAMPVLAGLLLAGCSPAVGDTGAESDRPLNPVRIDLRAQQAASVTPAVVREGDAKPVWSGNGTFAAFGYPQEAPLLTIGCAAGKLTVVRNAPADKGAQALFALIGSGGVVRLPVDARAMPGSDRLVWQGTLDGSDPAADIFTDGSVEATLPGAGRIVLPASDFTRQVVSACAPAKAETTPEAAETSTAPTDA